MQGEKNSLKATRVSKGKKNKQKTKPKKNNKPQKNKQTNQPHHKPSNQNIEKNLKIANCFSGIVQNPEGKDGRNRSLGLKSPWCQYCCHSLHMLGRNAIELLHFQRNEVCAIKDSYRL